MAHQSLYRRYRPQRFSEVRGQDVVVGALRTAVAEERVGHAYLFSGPRGTGKTSTARILAKALNCEDLRDGEPCCVCDSCVSMQAGTSYDLQELDAASKSKVDDIRALIESVALGSPGRTKVYILDEVHMLSPGASNALLKTLEEPPDHVVFVLATTDPQKVLPTIRSRTQHFEFHLLPAEQLDEHVRWVIADADLDVDDAAIEHVLRAGGGSARDTLSALDQAAAGGVSTDGDHAEALTEAVVDVDTAAALSAVATATVAGRDPRVLGESLLAHLRDVFLLRMGGPVDHLSDTARARVEAWAARTSDRAVTRALEEVGEALLAMRQAPDPRIPLEVALVRTTRSSPAAGDAGGPALDALVARLERLERTAAGGGAAPAAPAPAPAAPDRPADDVPAAAAPDQPPGSSGSGREAARAAVARSGAGSPPPRSRVEAPPASPPPPASPSPPAPTPPTSTTPPASPPPDGSTEAPPARPTEAADEGDAGRDGPGAAPAAGPAGGDVAQVWSDDAVPRLRGMAKALFKLGRVVAADGEAVTVGLPNQTHLDRCAEKRADAEEALAAALGRPVRLELVVAGERAEPDAPSDGGRGVPPPPEDPDDVDLDDLVDAPVDARTGIDRVTEAFPGAQVIDP